MMREVLEGLRVQPGGVIVDCTVGRGGHALEIARKLGKGGLLVGLDVDPRNLEFAKSRLSEAPCDVRLFHANFAELNDVRVEVGRETVDGILADLGVSTNQLFDQRYGLSFSADADLDMRLDPRIGENAADLVNKLPETDLANVLYELAQERWSRRIARKIVDAPSNLADQKYGAVGRAGSLGHSVASRRKARRGEDRPRHPDVSCLAHESEPGDGESGGPAGRGAADAGGGRSAGGHQLPVDGRPQGKAGVSVGGADRATSRL